MELVAVPVNKPTDMNLIVGQAHFIKTVETLHEALAGVGPHLRFGVAFCEASGPCLVRRSGNDDHLVDAGRPQRGDDRRRPQLRGLLEGGYPVSVLNALKQVPEVCGILLRHCEPR